MYDFLVGDTADISVPIKNHSGDVDRQHSESSSCETDKEKLIFFHQKHVKFRRFRKYTHAMSVPFARTDRPVLPLSNVQLP